MFTQIFLSEIISIAENGGQGTHFLISQILKGNNALCIAVHWSFCADLSKNGLKKSKEAKKIQADIGGSITKPLLGDL